MRRLRAALCAVTALTLLAASACGSGDPDTQEAADGTYKPVSDVTAHAAIGDDAAKIRDLLAPAKEGGAVDWAAVGTVFREGGASRKSDGSLRTLVGLAEDHPAVEVVNAAIDGTGASKVADDAVRAQRVDKGVTVLLAAKVLSELDSAAEKTSDGATDRADGAPHNVDEAWAFFVAKEQGPAVTADKRAADFGRERQVREPVVAALIDAQKAASAGDTKGLADAAAKVRAGVNHIFYLATYKYLEHEGEATTQAEGETFYLGIADAVRAASSGADAAIVSAFASGDADAGRAALNQQDVLSGLELTDTQRVTD